MICPVLNNVPSLLECKDRSSIKLLRGKSSSNTSASVASPEVMPVKTAKVTGTPSQYHYLDLPLDRRAEKASQLWDGLAPSPARERCSIL
ncbi:hypothetical protein BG011_003463 [Mortierella polycephala]|uniref:Uncharacterized protein n=1 Tax=Mortierella polycephala TaxID=41804 RepID=A0A9P6QHE5_9FUNG|nr:hypothetical protein BG011_003463 [Mortierella polycephala]